MGFDDADVTGGQRGVEGGGGAEKDAAKGKPAVVAEDTEKVSEFRAGDGTGGEKELEFGESVGVGVAGEGDEAATGKTPTEEGRAAPRLLMWDLSTS